MDYRTQFARAEHDPHEEMFFRSKLLGQPIRNKNVFFMMDQWEKCQGRYPDLTGCKAVIGLDNGGANDLMGIAVLIEKDGKLYTETTSALTESALEKKVRTGQLQYQAWVDKGYLHVARVKPLVSTWFCVCWSNTMTNMTSEH